MFLYTICTRRVQLIGVTWKTSQEANTCRSTVSTKRNKAGSLYRLTLETALKAMFREIPPSPLTTSKVYLSYQLSRFLLVVTQEDETITTVSVNYGLKIGGSWKEILKWTSCCISD